MTAVTARISEFPSSKSLVSGNKLNCFPRDQSLSVYYGQSDNGEYVFCDQAWTNYCVRTLILLEILSYLQMELTVYP